jgi:hypothetical protein
MVIASGSPLGYCKSDCICQKKKNYVNTKKKNNTQKSDQTQTLQHMWYKVKPPLGYVGGSFERPGQIGSPQSRVWSRWSQGLTIGGEERVNRREPFPTSLTRAWAKVPCVASQVFLVLGQVAVLLPRSPFCV